MGTAKVVSLSVVASQTSNLCFEAGGVLGELNVKLGGKAKAFDFTAFYALLGSMPTVPGHPARLVYDFLEIQTAVQKFALAALRSEPNKAALSKAVNSRANAFYAKYANAPDVIAKITQFYSPAATGSKPSRLEILSDVSQQQFDLLKSAYIDDSRTYVVRNTQSVLDSRLSSTGSSTTTDQNTQKSAEFMTAAAHFPPPAPGAATTVGGGDPVQEIFEEGNSAQSSQSSASATEHQTIVNTDYGYRVPYLENFAQYERAQISLIDERFASFMFAQNVPFLAAVFANELSSIDSDVYRTQIAYANTILMSPFNGTVTGVFKNLGDMVRPGEPVIRVENSDVVYLVAKIMYPGPISIGAGVTFETTLFDVPGPTTKITGNAVAVRGLTEDDLWEVVVEYNNLDGGGSSILPLGYHFDYDDTTASIT
ncbi:hypothetical protein [Paraburkholderia sp. J7]|uniref:hypothetical protein n=1 Tax=Paraburkholderia sp. J7 TaxID=2805438 RepID=UPI002AB6BD3D|nr:hypothetical protein [Paraburkholderia sp. J7]